MKGKLGKSGDRHTLRFERFYPHPPERVWQALIDPDALAQWFPAAIEGERSAGARLRFVFPSGEGPVLEGAMRHFEPPRLLEYTWGNDVLRWELTPRDGGCALVFTTTVEQRSNAPRDATGWDVCLESLDAVIAGRKPDAVPKERFAKLYASYVASFGLGAFPMFMQGPSSESVLSLLPNPALVGQAFESDSGTRMAALHAAGDGETREHLLERDAYIFVIEGEYTLRLGREELSLPAGTEFHVPSGGRVSGRVKAGTRLFYAVRGARDDGEAA